MRYDLETRHHRSIRLQGYDYASAGAYFVTICTRNRDLIFAVDAVRRIAEECWLEIPNHFVNVQLDEWVVMPNHLYGIIVILPADSDGIGCRGVQLNAPTASANTAANTNRDLDDPFSAISPSPDTLAVIVRTYKAAVTTLCRQSGNSHFGWQRNYYEHIVRSEDELNRIRQYVFDNPAKWDDDEYNPNRRFGGGRANR